MKAKIVVIFAVLVILFGIGSAMAGSIDREGTLIFRSPMDNFEANILWWYSLNQAAGATSDWLNQKYKIDDSLKFRLVNFATLTWIHLATGYYAHELGHAREARRYFDFSWRTDFGDWTTLAPEFEFSIDYASGYNGNWLDYVNRRIGIAAAGLNQEEGTAEFLDKRTASSITFDEGIGFLLRKFSAVFYDVYSERKFDTSEDGDVHEYTRYLELKGINISKGELYAAAGISALASLKWWDSLLAIWGYLKNGERVHACTILNIGGIEFTPPFVQLGLTDEGMFYNISSVIYPDSVNPIELSFGVDTDWLWGGELDTMRFGIKYRDLGFKSFFPLGISPYAYMNTTRSFGWEGLSVGTEMNLWIATNLAIYGKLEYNSDDIMESEIKGKGDGFYSVVGVSWEY